jgi:GNAT superfamily N-acetyltransferase
MSIRAALSGDARALARLRFQFRAELEPATETATHFLPRCERWIIERLHQPDRWRCWVASQDGRPVGCVWLQLLEKVPNPVPEPEEHGYVTNLYVVPQARRAGLGGALLEEALNECRRRRLHAVLLWPTPESQSLYRRHGFAPRGDVFVLENPAGSGLGSPFRGDSAS